MWTFHKKNLNFWGFLFSRKFTEISGKVVLEISDLPIIFPSPSDNQKPLPHLLCFMTVQQVEHFKHIHRVRNPSQTVKSVLYSDTVLQTVGDIFSVFILCRNRIQWGYYHVFSQGRNWPGRDRFKYPCMLFRWAHINGAVLKTCFLSFCARI